MTAHRPDSCFCCHGNNQRITPSSEDHDIVEIRPRRHLRIRHLNPQQRDNKFDKEMQIFMEYKRTGIIPATSLKDIEKGDNSSGLKKDNITVDTPLQNGSEKNSAERPTSDKLKNLRTEKLSTPDEDHKSVMSSSNISVVFDPQGKRLNLDHACRGIDQTIQEKEESTSLHSKSFISVKNMENPTESKESTALNGVINQQISDLQTNLTDVSNIASNNGQKVVSDTKDKVLFFVHGVGGSSDVWKAQIDFFSNLGYEIVAPDLIGHGLSFAPNDSPAYHFDEILDDMEEIFDRYCKRKNYLIGHSYGCAFLTVIARTRSRRVNKMILISGGGPSPLAPQPGMFTLPLCLLSCIQPCISCAFKRSVIQSEDELVVPRHKMFDIPSYVLSYIMNGQRWPGGDDVYHNWITVRTLLIYGQMDKLVSLEEEQDMNKTIYGSSLEVVENAGHMVMIEAPTKVNNLIHNFIEDRYGLVQQQTNQKQEDIEEEEDSSSHLSQPSIQIEREHSRLSQVSGRSVKSTKSMPKAWFSSKK